MVCDAVEGTGAELPSRPYIEEAGSETDEESGRGFQCRVIIFNILSLAPASAHNDRGDNERDDGGRSSCTNG